MNICSQPSIAVALLSMYHIHAAHEATHWATLAALVAAALLLWPVFPRQSSSTYS